MFVFLQGRVSAFTLTWRFLSLPFFISLEVDIQPHQGSALTEDPQPLCMCWNVYVFSHKVAW